MQRRLGRRDYLLLTVVCLALVVLAVQLPFGTRGFDRPQQGGHWRVLEAPGRLLGWGGVALLIVALPYALVAWLKGRAPGRALSALGAVVFGVGVGGLAGVLASSPVHGGGVAGGVLAQMLSDSLGAGFACALLGLIAIPGLFLALAPLVLDTGYAAKTGRPASPPPGRMQGGAGGTGSAGPATGKAGGAKLPPVLAKPWYPERHIGPDGEELPMSLGGSDVGPIRYREETPEAPGSTGTARPMPTPATGAAPPPAPRAAIPIATAPPPPPPSAGTKKPPVISGVRYRDEAIEPPAPLTKPPREPDPESDDQLPSGVRFAPGPAPTPAPVETPAPTAAPPPAPMPAEPPAPEPFRLPSASDVIDATFETAPEPAEPVAPPPPERAPADRVVAAWVAANPLPVPAPVEPSAISPAPSISDDAESGSDAAAPTSSSLHPSVVGHRRKLAESGMFEGPSPAADRPGRPPKPKPRPAVAKDWREALHGLFSSLPVEELPPIRVPDDLVGNSAEEEARLRADAPGQLKLFDASEPAPEGRASGTRDALFNASVDAALERGTASLVLLKRKLGVGYARAASLMDALVAEGVLGEMTASGSRPTLLTQAEWNRRQRR